MKVTNLTFFNPPPFLTNMPVFFVEAHLSFAAHARMLQKSLHIDTHVLRFVCTGNERTFHNQTDSNHCDNLKPMEVCAQFDRNNIVPQ